MNDKIVAFRKRSREAEGRGKSDKSWIKHDFAAKVVVSQVSAYRARFPEHKILLIDGNAGDGEGVDMAQRDLFVGEVRSRPTPEILTAVAERVGNADVCLCEHKRTKRAALWQAFPQAIKVANHSEIALAARDHSYALWISDPCGYSGHGIDAMRAVDARVRTDFIIISNEGSLLRLEGTAKDDPHWRTHRQRYLDQLDPHWWLEALGKRFVARSRLIHQSANFHFRILIVSNYLADIARREPFQQIISKKDPKLRSTHDLTGETKPRGGHEQ